MVSRKISKSCGMMSGIRNTLDIKSKKNDLLVSYTPFLLTVSMSGSLPIKQIWKLNVQPKRGQCVHSLLLLTYQSIKKICH